MTIKHRHPQVSARRGVGGKTLNGSSLDCCTRVGLDRRVRVEWLERTAQMALAGMNVPVIRAALERELEPVFRRSGPGANESLSKTAGILLKIWARPPANLLPLQEEGLGLLRVLPPGERIAVHWGMTMAVYPFWGAVALQVGRLLRLQKTVTSRQVQQRMREQLGDRETVSRAVRRVLRSFVDWGVLEDAGAKGVYTAVDRRSISDLKVTAWLVEAVLRSQPNGAASPNLLVAHPSLFPFAFKAVTGLQLADASPRLGLLRHGLDEELIYLNEEQA